MSAVVVLAYGAALAVVPVAHGATEVLWSTGTVESEHSDSCPTVHGGAACHALGVLQLAHPSPAVQLTSHAVASDVPLAASGAGPGRRRTPSPPPARAPPEG
jgi:hypothetical protein